MLYQSLSPASPSGFAINSLRRQRLVCTRNCGEFLAHFLLFPWLLIQISTSDQRLWVGSRCDLLWVSSDDRERTSRTSKKREDEKSTPKTPQVTCFCSSFRTKSSLYLSLHCSELGISSLRSDVLSSESGVSISLVVTGETWCWCKSLPYPHQKDTKIERQNL